jgi:hypothetical protein
LKRFQAQFKDQGVGYVTIYHSFDAEASTGLKNESMHHLAPSLLWRDPVFTEVHRRNTIDLSVLTVLPMDANHPYKGESDGGYRDLNVLRRVD